MWKATATAAMIALAGPALAAPCGAGGDGQMSVHYATGVTALKAEDKTRLSEFAEIAKFRDAVCVFAQVDAQGSDAANKRVAAKRADTVKRYLITKGVPAERILIAKEEESFTFFGLFDADQKNDRRVTVSYE